MNLYESIKAIKESYETNDPVQFEAVSFEKNIPHNMRFKTFDVIVDKDKTYLYWVTQCPFNRDELEQFQKAFKDTNFDAAYVTLRDLSGYDYYGDKGRDVLVAVGKDGYDANPYITAMKENWPDFDFDGEPYKSKYESEEKLVEDSTDKEDKDAKFREFANNIDLTPLYDKLKQMTGINNLEFTSKVIERPGDIYIDIKSNDLIDQCGLFKLALAECHIETFNSGIVTSKETNEPYWWGTMDLRYQSKQGGTNGVRFLRFSYNEEPNKWLFNEE